MSDHLRFYEQKYVKFYQKFCLETGNVKERLAECANDMDYAFSLSQIPDLEESIRRTWRKYHGELTFHEGYSNIEPMKSKVKASLAGKHKNSLKKYLEFFFSEYSRIKNK